MPEQTDEKKYHKISPKQKVIIGAITTLLLFIVGPVSAYYYYKFAVNRPSQIVDEITYTVKRGAVVPEIANDLYDLGVINSKALFTFYVNWNKIDRDIQAGVYPIPAGISIVNLADMLQHGVNDVKVTFLEGWRVEEFAREASIRLSNVDYNDFLKLARAEEGFLFPDTYMFNSEIQEGEVVKELRDTFDKKVGELLDVPTLQSLEMTKEEIINFASIVEREVHTEEDRPIVAGILIKRWKEDTLIGADATTQYAVALHKYCVPEACRNDTIECVLGTEVNYCLSSLSKDQAMEIDWWPKELTQYDLDFGNAYNTRKNLGLPPKPICNPGISAVESVINYRETPFYYYLNDSEGNTYFAETLEEHNLNVEKYL